jgi:hypothetical protein
VAVIMPSQKNYKKNNINNRANIPQKRQIIKKTFFKKMTFMLAILMIFW